MIDRLWVAGLVLLAVAVWEKPGVGAIGVRVEPKDKDGAYTVSARLRDKVSGAEVELKRTSSVVP